MDGLEAKVAELARPLRGPIDLDPLMDLVGDARYVLLGEASHGTSQEDPEELFGDVLRLLDDLQATVRLVFVDVARVPASVEGATPELVTLLEAEVARREVAQQHRLGRMLGRLPSERRAGALVIDRRDAAQAIVEHAPGHDLIVVRTHGRRGPARLWLGSVAERIVRSSPIPVLVLRGDVPALDGPGDRRILAAVDLDDGAQALAADAVRWGLAFRARVDALYVRPQVVLGISDAALAAAVLDADRAADRGARARLDGWMARGPAGRGSRRRAGRARRGRRGDRRRSRGSAARAGRHPRPPRSRAPVARIGGRARRTDGAGAGAGVSAAAVTW